MVKKEEKNLKINYLKEKCINNCNKNIQNKVINNMKYFYYEKLSYNTTSFYFT